MLHTRITDKYVRLIIVTYEGASMQVTSGAITTDKINAEKELHQGSSLSRYLFVLILDVMAVDTKDRPADDIVLSRTRREEVEHKLE